METDNIDKRDGCEEAITSVPENANPMPELPVITNPNISSYDQKPSEENDEFCDGPVTRTRSKVGGQTPEDIPSSFLVQIPHFAYKQEKNKKCQVCGKHARTPSDLLRHMRVHTGERPFPCVACEKTFKCKRSQLTHQYLSHAIKDGLSDHRLDVLDNRKVKRNSSKLKDCFSSLQMPSLIDQMRNGSYIKQEVYPSPCMEQDEDTEIVAGEDGVVNSESQISFGGLFSSHKENSEVGLKCQETDSPRMDERDTAQNVNGNMLSILNSCHNAFFAMNSVNERTQENGMTEDDYPDTTETRKELSKKVPVLRIKTHKCSYCKRQFRSIYTLRYHLRSMHDEKVYLSPALESRLKKRRWIPPHVRLQKSKISMSGSHSRRDHSVSVIKHSHDELYSTATPYRGESIDHKFLSASMREAHASDHSKSEDAMDLHINKDLTLEIKKEKVDSYEDEINNNNIPNSGNELNNRTLRDILTSASDVKQLSHFTESNAALNANGSSFNLNNSGSNNGSNPFVIPPHIFFPSTPAAEEGLMNEKPISWESLQVTSDSVLISKLEAIHPGTQQKYVLYKCGLCGKAFASLRVICAHLAVHNDASKDKDCEKCGASFKWRNELDAHMECHQVSDRKFVPTSPYLPSYYVNPFPIPVVTPTEQNVMSATGLLPYPFFPMPQQIPPMMQPGFFPFFAAALQTSGEENALRNGTRSPTENNKGDNFDDKNIQGCTFQCKLCPKTFDRIFSLQRHERIHSGVKACFCKVCGRGFSELRNLRHHIIRFHADSAQREPLPYRRRPNRIRNVSSSQKLVSFLKKTAVRILNSMGQSKVEPLNQTEVSSSSVKIQTEEVKESDKKEPENLSKAITTTIEQSTVNSEPVSSMPQLYDATSHTSQSHPTQDLNEIPPPRLSPGAIIEKEPKKETSSSEKGKNGTVELMQDPKRSLLGNRRKGRPFKLSTSSYSTLSLRNEDLLFSMTDPSGFLEKQNDVITTSNLLQAAEALSGCMKSELGFPTLNFFNPEPPPNEPIDMRFPNINKEKSPIPPPISALESSEPPAQQRATAEVDSTVRIGIVPDPLQNSQALKLSDLKDSFESRCMFPCSYCHKSFNSLTDLNRHMSFHADIRPFKCPYCSYCSRTNSQLKVHMMRHEGIKHYMCQICNYNGVTQSDLNRHLKTRTHLLRSRNVCACCGTGFHTRSLSDEHFKSCHLTMGSGSQEQSKAVQETSTNKSSSANRNRVTRLKQFRTSEDKIKNDFYQKLCDLNNMGLTLGDFLQQSSGLNLEK